MFPKLIQKKILFLAIIKLQSKFITTYMQSLQAEYNGLDEISGLGFRKAIEYLVKDYLIHRDNSLQGSIENEFLAKVIKENFSHAQESDLKELIKLVVDEIHSIEQKRHYIATIQSKYK